MEYKIRSEAIMAGSTIRGGTDHSTASHGTVRTGSGSIKTGTTVSIQSSFQEFLNQQTGELMGQQLQQQPLRQAASRQPRQPVSPTSAATPQRETVHILKKGENVWDLARKKYQVDPAEILRLNSINDPRNLHVGQRLRIPTGNKQGDNNAGEAVVASWYGKYHQGKLMANGDPFDMYGATIAHRDIAIGTVVELENPQTGEKAKAVVTDRGPFERNRDIDLSYGLAKRLSIARQGVGNLKMRVL